MGDRQTIVEHAKRRLVEGDDGAWIEVRGSAWTKGYLYFCATAIVTLDEDDEHGVMSSGEWGWYSGSSRPELVTYYEGGDKVAEYEQWSGRYGHQPLVLDRHYYGIFDDETELLEEFRLLFNLKYDARSKRYYAVLDNGRIEEVARAEDEPYSRLVVSRHYLERFLAAKGASALILFDATHYSPPLGEPNETEIVRESGDGYFAEITSGTIPGPRKCDYERLLGKRLLRPGNIEDCGIWPFEGEEEDEEYPEFIIGVDERGRPVRASCNPEDRVEYLTPVFFNRNVLSKYYANPKVYEVRDGFLACGTLWGVAIDNDSPEAVMVFLGDLGRDIPESERPYWLSFNIVPPVRGASATVFERSIMAQFKDAESPDLVFKRLLYQANELWEAREGWGLFKPLGEEDEHALKALHIPLNDDQREFDEQVLALTKTLIDSLNEKGLVNSSEAAKQESRGIKRLAAWLNERGATGYEQHIEFLGALWALRHGAGHRKGDDYQRAATYFELEEKGLIEGYRGVLGKANGLLEYLMREVPGEGAEKQ